MRTRIVVAAALSLAASVATAQSRAPVEIAPFIGYRFGGSVHDYYGDSQSVHDSASEGLTLTLPIGPADGVELLYSHQHTDVRTGSPTGTRTYPLDVDYLMLGGLHAFPGRYDRLRPFLTGSVGAAHTSTSQGTVTNATRFALGIGGGVKYDLGRTVSLRFDLRALLVFVNGSAGIFCSGGCAATFNGSGLVQGEASAGVVFKLGG